MSKNKERKEHFHTISELEVQPYYDAKDRNNSRDPLPEPGEYPFTRGVHRTMYRGRLWTMRQYAGFGTAAEANERYHYLLKQGTSGLSVAFDLPTQMGRDADHPRSKGEVGKVGVSISSVEDMEVLFKGIPLDKISVSMTINSTAAILLALMLVAAEKQGIGWEKLRGTIQNDILKEYMARGTYIYPPRPALRIVTDLFQFCSEKVPNWNAISISGYHIREAGSTAVEEVAFTLANAITYVESALKAGLKIDDFAPQIAFFFNAQIDFLEEVAKFRAARRLWAKIVKERFGAKKPESMMLRFHTQTAGVSLSAQQPMNNIVRTTVEALAAVLGGTQSLHTNAFDEALGLPTEESARVALRTQQIIAEESGVTHTVDPLGGSYLVEAWTDRIEKEAAERIAQIDQMGGMVAAIEKGFPQSEIERSAYQFQQNVESGEFGFVGVNKYVSEESAETPIQRLDPKGEQEQCARLAKLRKSRDAGKVEQCLAALKSAAQGSENLVPLIVEACRNKVTLGEISDTLREEFGEYR